jgi:hypothetical protein
MPTLNRNVIDHKLANRDPGQAFQCPTNTPAIGDSLRSARAGLRNCGQFC